MHDQPNINTFRVCVPQKMFFWDYSNPNDKISKFFLQACVYLPVDMTSSLLALESVCELSKNLNTIFA